MRTIRSVVFVLALVICGHATADPGWQALFEDAEATAARDRVPLLIHFHASWCGPCRKMDREVFSSLAVQRALQDGLVAVKVETTQRPDLGQRFGAKTIPRDIVVYPDGRVETVGLGFVPASSYLTILRDTAAQGRMIAMSQEDAADDSRNQSPLFTGPDPSGPLQDVEGLSGYCPVKLMEDREWIQGNPDLAERYRGVVYYFSGLLQRDRFLSNPDRYAPRNLGCDPVVLHREQRAVTGRIQYGMFFRGNLYLFRTASNRDTFRRDPRRYTRIQHAVNLNKLSGQTYR